MTSTTPQDPSAHTVRAAGADLRVHAVRYTYAPEPDHLAAVRPAHRAFLRDLLDRGLLLASGPWTGSELCDPPGGTPDPAVGVAQGLADGAAPGALLLLRAPDEAACLHLLDRDPFALAGLVRSRRVRVWDPVLGPWAEG